MVYIHVKKIGNKQYYSLRISVRKGDKVITKDLCNLGSDLSKIDLLRLERKYKDKVRRSYRTLKRFLDTNHYVEKVKKTRIQKSHHYSREQQINIKAICNHYSTNFLKRDKLTKKEAYESFLINFAVNSTSIEGNTITLREANRLFKEDIIPKDRTLREVYDLTNTKKAIEYLSERKPKVTIELLAKIHDILLDKIDTRLGFRNNDIHIYGQPFKPTPHIYIKSDLKLILDWYKKNMKKIHPLALVTLFHHKFENIHPFSDGNGRTGRIILNYLLSSFNYPPFIISRRFRKQYLDSLNKADKSLKKSIISTDIYYYKSLIDFIYSQFKLSYWDTFL